MPGATNRSGQSFLPAIPGRLSQVMEVSLGNLGHFNPDEMEATELEKPEDGRRLA